MEHFGWAPVLGAVPVISPQSPQIANWYFTRCCLFFIHQKTKGIIIMNSGFSHNPLRWQRFQGNALTDLHPCVNVCILYLEPVFSNRGLGQIFHVTQRSLETKAQQGLNPESWQETDGSSGGWAVLSQIRRLARGYYRAANSFSVPHHPGD